MPSYDEHCKASKSLLGEDFGYVHKFLDEFFLSMGPKHRKFRHHNQGIEQVREKWGDRAAEAAELHITMDLCNLPVPDEIDYIGGTGCWPVGKNWNC